MTERKDQGDTQGAPLVIDFAESQREYIAAINAVSTDDEKRRVAEELDTSNQVTKVLQDTGIAQGIIRWINSKQMEEAVGLKSEGARFGLMRRQPGAKGEFFQLLVWGEYSDLGRYGSLLNFNNPLELIENAGFFVDQEETKQIEKKLTDLIDGLPIYKGMEEPTEAERQVNKKAREEANRDLAKGRTKSFLEIVANDPQDSVLDDMWVQAPLEEFGLDLDRLGLYAKRGFVFQGVCDIPGTGIIPQMDIIDGSPADKMHQRFRKGEATEEDYSRFMSEAGFLDDDVLQANWPELFS